MCDVWYSKPMSTAVMQAVNRLPAETTARLRSTIILTSLPQIVSELVQNALDAGARHVNVGVDPVEWTCWVQDDGHGISVENLQTIGMSSDAGRYGRPLPLCFMTVECRSTDTSGFLSITPAPGILTHLGCDILAFISDDNNVPTHRYLKNPICRCNAIQPSHNQCIWVSRRR